LWSTKTKEKKIREEVADARGEKPLNAYGERLKNAFCFWG